MGFNDTKIYMMMVMMYDDSNVNGDLHFYY